MDGTVRVWDPDGGAAPVVLAGDTDPVDALIGHTESVDALAVLPDGRVGSAGKRGVFTGTLRVRDPDGGADPVVLAGHTGFVSALAVLPDGRLASGAAGSWDGTVRVWDPDGGAEPVVLTGHTAGVIALAVLPDGRLASGGASAWMDGTVRVWDPDGNSAHHVHMDGRQRASAPAQRTWVSTPVPMSPPLPAPASDSSHRRPEERSRRASRPPGG